MPRMLGNGAVDKAAEKLLKRRVQQEEMLEEPEQEEAAPAHSKPRKLKDASAGAMRERQMQEAIEMVRKKKSAKRTDYQ